MRKKISTPPLPPDPHKGRNLTFHHEGYKEHEVKKFKSINFQNLRVLRALRGEIVLLSRARRLFSLQRLPRYFGERGRRGNVFKIGHHLDERRPIRGHRLFERR